MIRTMHCVLFFKYVVIVSKSRHVMFYVQVSYNGKLACIKLVVK